MNLRKISCSFLMTLLSMIFYTNSFATTVTFNANQSNTTNFMGFGTQVWAGIDVKNVTMMYQSPGLRYARINHQVRLQSTADWENFPTTDVGNTPVTISEYHDNYWVPYGDGLTNLSGGKYGAKYPAQVQFLFLSSIPCPFVDSTGYGAGYCKDASGDFACDRGGCSLIDNDVYLQSLANYIAAGVKHFTDAYQKQTFCPGCYSANYVELANEPNGNWDAQFSTEQYTQLVKYVYLALESLGSPYSQTLITGPGVGNMDWNTLSGTDIYTSAILSNATALSNLGAFSIHNYIYAKVNGVSVENVDAQSSIDGHGQTANRYYFPLWYSSPKSIAPSKPVIATEMNTEASGFHGVNYGPPNGHYLCNSAPYTSANCTIVNTVPYGVRIYTYMISLLAAGANVPIYWEAQDQSWEASAGGQGLVDLNGNYKTIYYALEPLFQYIQPNSSVLVSPSTQAGDDIYSVAFLSPVFLSPPVTGRQIKCVTIALANGTGKSTRLFRTTTVTGLPKTAQLLSSSSTTLFSQSTARGSTVYQGQLRSPDPNTRTLTLRNGTLTHTTSLANDTAVTVDACYAV